MNTCTRIETPAGDDPFLAPVVAPIVIGFESQLFVDDYLIEKQRVVLRRVNAPEKVVEPILQAVEPWEGVGVTFGTVIDEGETLRLYYRGLPPYDAGRNVDYVAKHGYGKSSLCLATSEDGLSFQRVMNANSQWPGTNIVMSELIDDFAIFREEAAGEAKYKMVCSWEDWQKGLSIGGSADGLRWDFPAQKFAIANLGDRCSLWFDPQTQEYVVWSRCYPTHPDRVVAERRTKAFDDWSDPERKGPWLPLMPDRDDPEGTYFYGGHAFWYQSLYLGYLEVYHHIEQRVDTQLVCSRDGRRWTRVGRRGVFMANGGQESFDRYWTVPTFNAPVKRDGKLLIHFEGRPAPHLTEGFRHVKPGMPCFLGVSTLREDGFVSLDATGNEGTVLTHVLKGPEGARGLEVNVTPFMRYRDAFPMEVDVEVLSPEGGLLEAWRLTAPVSDTTVWHQVALTSGIEGDFRLRFRMRNARLYSFRLTSV